MMSNLERWAFILDLNKKKVHLPNHWKMIQTILDKELVKDALGIENDNTRKSLISDLVSSAKEPSKNIVSAKVQAISISPQLAASH